MVQIFVSELKMIFKSKKFLCSLILAILLVVSSDIQWFSWREETQFSVFIKLIFVTKETYGAELYYRLFPLIMSFPCICMIGEYFNSRCVPELSIKKYVYTNILHSCIGSCCIVIIVILLDFIVLSMMTETYYPIPHDYITTMFQKKFCSSIFYTHPRIFVIIWMFTQCLWSVAFVFLGAAICLIVKKRIFSLLLIFLFVEIEDVIAVHIDFLSWKDLFIADASGYNTPVIIFGNIFFILLFSIVIIMFKTKKYMNCKNLNFIDKEI